MNSRFSAAVPSATAGQIPSEPGRSSATDRIPATVVDLDVTGTLPDIAGFDPAGRRVERAWLLVRQFTQPIGALLLDVPPQGLTGAELAATIDQRIPPASRPEPGYLARRADVLADAPHITVVVCTRERPAGLARTLDSLLAQRYPRFRVLVVDNAPVSDATARVVADVAGRPVSVDYVREPRPGLSHARNRAIRATAGEIVAWIDDDEVADPDWLAEIARALADHPHSDAVTGAIAPAELVTDAQLWFEQYGGHSKGRGFTPDVFSPATAHRQSPLYPLPPFGAGGNMVFRPGVLERVGGFDTALGAGTPAMGSEDTLALMQVLVAGGTVAYQPSALVWHHHRRDLAGLRKQLVGYGTGLTAAYTSLLLREPRLLGPLLRLVPTALRDILGDGDRLAGLRDDFPRDLIGANRRGLLTGPIAYLRSRLADRRLRRRLRDAA
ncbi:glycosyltransferase family A protein [Solwaraspora sp. WMMD406]|uniref:glycosyltransferase family A protein n=1 Tax=Solwaraspora sp. WMMD406 TaxID=3016095 RepID=UPI002415C67E|nr:glycosyltransferase family A protein [Solwaraspora sp. WMMD406]MDG4767415.1 glycosyltransferase family A protein [Solwaraspora sp. WMMD406]